MSNILNLKEEYIHVYTFKIASRVTFEK